MMGRTRNAHRILVVILFGKWQDGQQRRKQKVDRIGSRSCPMVGFGISRHH